MLTPADMELSLADCLTFAILWQTRLRQETDSGVRCRLVSTPAAAQQA
jgi:hypothetical protein